MKRNFIVLFFILTQTLSGFSQNYRNNCKEAERIKLNENFYWAESEACKSLDAADRKALKNLIKSVSDNNAAGAIFFDDDSGDGNEKIFNTFSESIKKISKQLILSAEPQTKVFRYMEKADFEAVCSARENNVKFYLNEGLKAEQQLRVGDALRFYYWSMMLCHSHPDGANIMFEEPDFQQNVPAYKWLVNHVKQVLSEINFIPRKDSEKTRINLSVNYLGNPVNGLFYSYNNGEGFVRNSTNNGISLVELKDSGMDSFIIKIDLQNKEEAKHFDREVFDIMEILDNQIFFTDANKTVSLKNVKKTVEETSYSNEEIAGQIKESGNLLDEYSVEDKDYSRSMMLIEKALRDGQYENARSCFSDEGYKMLTELAAYGKISVIGKPKYRFIDFNGEVICRSIPMQFDFKNNVGFCREVVFRFDAATKKVTSLAFRLSDIAESDILGKGRWNKDSRLTLINFMEDYQTAYILKRLDYLNQIFSDDALIIVGHVVKKREKTDNVLMKDKRLVKLTQMTKSDYMTKLGRVFGSTEFINIRFTETDFIQSNSGEELYGVQVKQEYLSNSYGDVGYLFLMVDLRDKMPVIHVRAWQPDKTPIEDQVNLGSFEWESGN